MCSSFVVYGKTYTRKRARNGISVIGVRVGLIDLRVNSVNLVESRRFTQFFFQFLLLVSCEPSLENSYEITGQIVNFSK